MCCVQVAVEEAGGPVIPWKPGTSIFTFSSSFSPLLQRRDLHTLLG